MVDRFRVDDVKDLFREDVQRIIDGMRAQLKRLVIQPRDAAALETLRDYGHSLKGSAGLVSLTYLSQAGELVDSVGGLAADDLRSDPRAAASVFRQTQRALPVLGRLLDDALAGGTPEAQENIFTELLHCFSDRVRAHLQTLAANKPNEKSAKESDDEEWAAQLAEIFLQELHDNLVTVPRLIDQVTETATQRQAYYDLSRVFHTIKGSAAMVGRTDLSEAAKFLQDAFGEASDSSEFPETSRLAAQDAMDRVFAAAGLEAPHLPATSEATSGPTMAIPELDRELLDAFMMDASESIEASERLLLDLERQPDDRACLQALFRQFHTLKGAAAAVGLDAVAGQLHHAESLLDAVLDGEVRVDSARLVDFLFRLTDSVNALVNAARGIPGGQRTILCDVAAEVASLVAGLPAVTVEPLPEPVTEAIPAPTEASPSASSDPEGTVVRIQAARLDTLMNQVTQLVVSRTRMDRKIEAFAELRDKLDYCRRRLADLIHGFQEHYEYTIGERNRPIQLAARAQESAQTAAEDVEFFTDLEFDKYDDVNILARSVIELATDTGEIGDQLGRLIDSLGEESRQFSKVTGALQRQITRLRLVPLDAVYRRLARPVRDAARQEGKLIDLQLEGGDVQLDKSIVEALHAPLLHLVRNAVSHGIEPPAARQAAGKPTAGTVRISAQLRHNSVLIEVHDDGGGIDFDAILAKGRALGLIEPTAHPGREQLLPLILRAGFSTGETVTDLSGRGVGMDVVARDIAALNGSLLIDSKDGEGTTVRMVLPTMTTIDEVLLLQAGTQRYALPADFVEQAISIQLKDLVDVDGQRMLQIRNELLPVLFMAPLADEPPPTHTAMAMILRAGDRAMALIVDRVEPQREVVIRPLGRVLEGHPFLSGATIAGDGAVIFVLHVGRLFDALAAEATHQSTFILGPASDEAPLEAHAVLVVDDSISVRKLAARFLESDGIEVDTATDGLNALEKLATGRFRLVVTDLEMPRMHGYELIAEIRRNRAFAHLPVIVCSSRSSDKHRQRAHDVGAQGYITKPFTKEQLLAEMERVSGGAPMVVADASPEYS